MSDYGYLPPSMRARRIKGAVAVVTIPRQLTVAELDARAAACGGCQFNVGDKCQHLAQNCPPCKQGESLSVARSRLNFQCPENKFPKL